MNWTNFNVGNPGGRRDMPCFRFVPGLPSGGIQLLFNFGTGLTLPSSMKKFTLLDLDSTYCNSRCIAPYCCTIQKGLKMVSHVYLIPPTFVTIFQQGGGGGSKEPQQS